MKLPDFKPIDIVIIILLGIFLILSITIILFNWFNSELLAAGNESLFNGLLLKLTLIVSMYVGSRLASGDKDKDKS